MFAPVIKLWTAVQKWIAGDMVRGVEPMRIVDSLLSSSFPFPIFLEFVSMTAEMYLTTSIPSLLTPREDIRARKKGCAANRLGKHPPC